MLHYSILEYTIIWLYYEKKTIEPITKMINEQKWLKTMLTFSRTNKSE